MQWVMVAVGGALGAMGRFGVNALIYPTMGGRFPMGTLVVNVVGSVLMGMFYVLIIERGQAIIVSFLSDANTFDANFPTLERFLRSIEF